MPLTLLTMASCLVGLVYLLDIVNFNATNLEWKTTFRKSKILSWAAPTTNKGAINLFAVGHLTSENLAEPLANYGYEPVYRVNLILEQDVAVALQKENGPLKDESSLFHYPLTSRTATLSAKLLPWAKTLLPLARTTLSTFCSMGEASVKTMRPSWRLSPHTC
jgi:hypothetical protein